MVYREFVSRHEGSIGVMAATLLGIMTVTTVGAVDYALAIQARQDAQHALDTAAISASRIVVAVRNAEQGDADAPTGSLRQELQDRGMDAFDMNFDSDRTSDTRLRFAYVDDRIDASAEIRYEPMLSNVMGIFDFDFRVVSRVAIHPAQTKSGAVCISALSGNVDIGSGTVDAPDCAISATGSIASSVEAGAKLTCADGICDHADPFDGLAPDFVGGSIRSQGCQGEFGSGSGTMATSYSGTIKFCTHVSIAANHTFSLNGGTFLFEEGLTVESGGTVDSTGGGGGTIVLGAGATLHVMPGATFMVSPPASGSFAGISIAAVAGSTMTASMISAESPGQIVLNGVVYMPGHSLTLRGPDDIELQGGDLALWADEIGLGNDASLPGSPTTEGPGLPSISLQTSAPKTRLSQ